MANDIALVTDEEIAALAESLGSTAEDLAGGAEYIPQLKINYEEEINGKEVKKGLFFIKGADVLVFAKTVDFRPLMQHFQWTKYDKVTEKVVNRTRLIQNFREEARDETGTLRCGKPPSKEIKANPALAEKYKDITCYRQVIGLVTYEGVDLEGNTVKVEGALCSIRLKGSNFTPFQDEFIDVMPKGSSLWDFPVKLSTSREKNGASTYYIIHFEPDFGVQLPKLVRGEIDALVEVKKGIDDTNKEIDSKFYAAVNSRNEDDDAIDALASVASGRPGANRFLQADMNDEDIPF